MSPNKWRDNEIKTVRVHLRYYSGGWWGSIQWHEIAEIGWFAAKSYTSLPFHINLSCQCQNEIAFAKHITWKFAFPAFPFAILIEWAKKPQTGTHSFLFVRFRISFCYQVWFSCSMIASFQKKYVKHTRPAVCVWCHLKSSTKCIFAKQIDRAYTNTSKSFDCLFCKLTQMKFWQTDIKRIETFKLVSKCTINSIDDDNNVKYIHTETMCLVQLTDTLCYRWHTAGWRSNYNKIRVVSKWIRQGEC